ncbi:Crp/Fnr family transcriptional regulator [Dictyobacter arantiisoli]|uniref:Crp/Fnr family transcriptional regulator n=1 Tax=Dictyobacter arantiisoli TaxID=2014874 RepID=A0A5A5T9R6_9CHLR|nr:Crp/Fnr family transcriptional regulator [Dictyobacter arantiisoli]GCF08250.1 hypothetical protein KDI_18140 [Dictyobacter arantiisoli]
MRGRQTSSPETALTPGTLPAEKSSFLAHNALFRQLNAQDARALDQITTSLTCSPGRILYRPGEANTALFFIQTGSMQLYHLSTDGRKLITATLGSGTCCGEQCLWGQPIYTSFAEATTTTILFALNTSDLANLLLHHPAISFILMQMIGQRLTSLETQLVNTTFKSVTARLADLLLQLASAPTSQANQPLIVNGLSHEELADRLGVYRETVSAALRELKELQAIQPGRKRITIHRPDLLQQVAQTSSKTGLHRRE